MGRFFTIHQRFANGKLLHKIFSLMSCGTHTSSFVNSAFFKYFLGNRYRARMLVRFNDLNYFIDTLDNWPSILTKWMKPKFGTIYCYSITTINPIHTFSYLTYLFVFIEEYRLISLCQKWTPQITKAIYCINYGLILCFFLPISFLIYSVTKSLYLRSIFTISRQPFTNLSFSRFYKS